MKRSRMLVAVAAILAAGVGVAGCTPASAEESRKVKTTLLRHSFSGGAKSEKANGIYWMYLEWPNGDGVSILMESGAEFKIAYEGDSVTIAREVVDAVDIVVPDTLGGKKVRGLGMDSFGELFRCCAAMTSIYIPNGVTNFFDKKNPLDAHDKLKRIVVNKDHPTYSVRDGVLYDKPGKTLMCCPAGIEGDFSIPDGVETVEGNAFSGCSRISGLTIPPSVRTVRGGLVPWGDGLREIHISDIAAWCGIQFERTGLIIGDEVGSANPLAQAHNLYLDGKLVTDVVIPEGVVNVGDMAFIGCMSLRTVSLPGSVTNIGWKAFADCTALEEVKIGEGVKTIGDSAFAKCTLLREVEIPDGVTSIGFPIGSRDILRSGVFNGCVSLRRVVLPKTLREIPENAFFGCAELNEVELPEGVERIGSGAFYGCERLINLEIPNGVKEIGVTAEFALDIKGVFEKCGLHKIEIPDSVRKIGARAFAGCEDLLSVKMSSNVKSVGAGAFDGCERLKFEEKPMPGFEMRGGIVVKRTAPLGETLDLTGTKGISDDALGGLRRLYDDVETDPELAKLRRVIFPDGMETINLNTFGGCGNLQELTIPPSVTEVIFGGIGGIALCQDHIKRINIRDIAAWSRINFDVDVAIPCRYCSPGHPGIPVGSSNPLSGGAALYLDGKRLTEVVVPGSAGRVGKGAFYRYGELKSVVIEDGVKSIGDYAFCGCTNLVAVSIPDSVTNIGRQAFLDCTKLKSIKAPKSIKVKIGTREALLREVNASHR